MKPPKDVKIIDTETSIYWMENDGLVCSISKKTPVQTLMDTKKMMEILKEMIGEKKICILADATYSSEISKEVRDYVAVEFPKFIKAIAILSCSPLGRMIANLYFKLKAQPYPIKIFKEETEAREWIKQYI